MFTETVGLAEWIIDNTCLVLIVFFKSISDHSIKDRPQSFRQRLPRKWRWKIAEKVG